MTDRPPEEEPGAVGPILADLLDDLAAEFADVERREGPTGIDYAVRGKDFSHVTGGAASFRLRPEIVLAAARTPGATVSRRGPEWVSFSPSTLDQYSLDRLQSWFELAHRLAAEERSKAH